MSDNTNFSDVDQLLASAARVERATHTDHQFIERVEAQLASRSVLQWQLQWLLPGVGLLLAALFALTFASAELSQLGAALVAVSEALRFPELGSMVSEIGSGARFTDGQGLSLWTVAGALFALILPWYVAGAE